MLSCVRPFATPWTTSSVISQARILEWVSISYSRVSSQASQPTCVSCKIISSVQFSSVSQSCPTLCNPMDHRTPGIPVHHQIPESTQTQVHWVSDAIQLSHPLCPLLLPPSIFPSIRVFSSQSVLWIRWPKYWSFSFNINLANEYSGLISFRMD